MIIFHFQKISNIPNNTNFQIYPASMWSSKHPQSLVQAHFSVYVEKRPLYVCGGVFASTSPPPYSSYKHPSNDFTPPSYSYFVYNSSNQSSSHSYFNSPNHLPSPHFNKPSSSLPKHHLLSDLPNNHTPNTTTTPYKGRKRCFGEFECTRCHRK